jgi:hypothetical protein
VPAKPTINPKEVNAAREEDEPEAAPANRTPTPAPTAAPRGIISSQADFAKSGGRPAPGSPADIAKQKALADAIRKRDAGVKP